LAQAQVQLQLKREKGFGVLILKGNGSIGCN